MARTSGGSSKRGFTMPLQGLTRSCIALAHMITESNLILGCLVLVLLAGYYQFHRRQEDLMRDGSIGGYYDDRGLEDVEVIVDSVSDGDSFKGRFVGDEVAHRFRLRRIDAPELSQEGGKEAKAALEQLLLKGRLVCKTGKQLRTEAAARDEAKAPAANASPLASLLLPTEMRPQFPNNATCFSPQARGDREATSLDHQFTTPSTTPFSIVVVVWEKDHYGRYVVDVFVTFGVYYELIYVQEQLVRGGHAWVYNRFFGTRDLEADEARAREERNGLWSALPPPSPPPSPPTASDDEKTGGTPSSAPANANRPHRPAKNYRYDTVGRFLDGWSPEDGPMPPWVYRKLNRAGKLDYVLSGEYFASVAAVSRSSSSFIPTNKAGDGPSSYSHKQRGQRQRGGGHRHRKQSSLKGQK